MASLIQDLNELLVKTRTAHEAIRAVIDEYSETDTDIVDGLEDIADAERWSSSGLYHRITQLDGTPTLLNSDLTARISEIDSLPDKLSVICEEHQDIARLAIDVLARDDLDEPTRELVTEISNLHWNTSD